MTIDEVFPRPTVKQVAFQIRFPHLFYIENKIGDLQLEIMKEFPESSLIFQRQLLFVDTGESGNLNEVPRDMGDKANKIWKFKSKQNYELNVRSNSITIISQYHKTYNLGDKDKFRDIIEFVIGSFLKVMPIPVITRIGLRYIDQCPIELKENTSFQSYYNSTFPLDRFDLSEASEMDFKTTIKRNDCFLRYFESLSNSDEGYKLILDFDGYKNNINPQEYLDITDQLHKIISEEYELTIKKPVYDYMKSKSEG